MLCSKLLRVPPQISRLLRHSAGLTPASEVPAYDIFFNYIIGDNTLVVKVFLVFIITLLLSAVFLITYFIDSIFSSSFGVIKLAIIKAAIPAVTFPRIIGTSIS